MQSRAAKVGLAVGLLITPVAAFFAMASAGAGHGDYVIATLLFPFTMLMLSPETALLGLLQFPLYGWLIGRKWHPPYRELGLWVVACVHLTALVGNSVIATRSPIASIPESSWLCEVKEHFGWDKQSNGGELTRNDVTYFVSFSDASNLRRVARPVKNAYWIEIYGFTAGRDVGWKSPPVIYNPSDAVIRIGGQDIPALPRVWRSRQIEGHMEPAEEMSVPLNLNDAASELAPGFFIAFPMRQPNPRDGYELLPGTALLDGERVQLPVLRSCYTPTKHWWSRMK